LPPFRPVTGLSPISYRPCRSHHCANVYAVNASSFFA
jgi:hypothetical protein